MRKWSITTGNNILADLFELNLKRYYLNKLKANQLFHQIIDNLNE
jgi:hypothetical protein